MRHGVQVAARQRISELRKNLTEDAGTQVLRDFFFVQARFVERVGMKSPLVAVPALRQKSLTLEEQVKQAQRVAGLDVVQLGLNAAHTQRGGYIHFKKLFGA